MTHLRWIQWGLPHRSSDVGQGVVLGAAQAVCVGWDAPQGDRRLHVGVRATIRQRPDWDALLTPRPRVVALWDARAARNPDAGLHLITPIRPMFQMALDLAAAPRWIAAVRTGEAALRAFWGDPRSGAELLRAVLNPTDVSGADDGNEVLLIAAALATEGAWVDPICRDRIAQWAAAECAPDSPTALRAALDRCAMRQALHTAPTSAPPASLAAPPPSVRRL